MTPEKAATMHSGAGYPNGWFAVAFSDEVRRGKTARRLLAGEEVLVYRTVGGTIRAVDPYCPHLGANIGFGGTVDGEHLVCPFHRFAFDVSGKCVRTEYGTAPPRAVVRHRPVDEVNGVVFVWRHRDASAPTWHIPKLALNDYPHTRQFTARLRGHPQDVVENAVDIGHITPVHGYNRPRLRNVMSTEGHILRIGPAVRRDVPLVGSIDVDFDVEAHGLGFEYVSAVLTRPQLSVVIQMMPTLRGPKDLEIRFRVAAKADSRRFGSAINSLTAAVLTNAVGRLFWRDFKLDFQIWEHKKYVLHPRLAHGDGPIPQFRRWAAQFYSTDAEKGNDARDRAESAQ
ncbi:Rieske 2Fe-2S domain-containing protein [Embleya sp. NPDC050493]|uniref:Rieske 2Fe-2S domain-containing protein n=1 Tax=Embleya sp. NPDC050493 TaxID=3363989 RepID=UPI0037B4D21A